MLLTWEACGTSGMKVLVNGGINLSELDGWWAEAYTPEVGWAIGDKQEHGEDPAWNASEANTLYDLLEQQIVPEFYSRNENGIPVKWIERMRNSMATLTAQFSANRTVREYTEKFYLRAASDFLKRSEDKGAKGKRITDAKNLLHSKWSEIHFGEVITERTEKGFSFDATIFFDDSLKDKISIEIFAMGIDDGDPEIVKMNLQSTSEYNNEHIYHAEVNTGRMPEDYTLRIIPCYQNIAVPIEDNLILWQQ